MRGACVYPPPKWRKEAEVSDTIELQKIVGQVAAAYFSNSHVSPGEIPTVIGQIASSLGAVGAPAGQAEAESTEETKLTSAQIRRSIRPEALISFEDSKPYKTLRRHLAVRGLSPDDYRAKWGLPKDYPMVAPSYSEARSAMAKALGLGSRVSAQAQPAAAAAAAPKRQTKGRSPSPRGRKPRSATPSAGTE
jgi:predicted transcriptional regulator